MEDKHEIVLFCRPARVVGPQTGLWLWLRQRRLWDRGECRWRAGAYFAMKLAVFLYRVEGLCTYLPVRDRGRVQSSSSLASEPGGDGGGGDHDYADESVNECSRQRQLEAAFPPLLALHEPLFQIHHESSQEHDPPRQMEVTHLDFLSRPLGSREG